MLIIKSIGELYSNASGGEKLLQNLKIFYFQNNFKTSRNYMTFKVYELVLDWVNYKNIKVDITFHICSCKVEVSFHFYTQMNITLWKSREKEEYTLTCH